MFVLHFYIISFHRSFGMKYGRKTSKLLKQNITFS